jgi:PAS domain S-box-containing protein
MEVGCMKIIPASPVNSVHGATSAASHHVEQRLKDYAEIAAEWFWEIDSNLKFTYSQGRVGEITGISSEDLVNPNPQSEHTQRFLSLWNSQFKKSDPHQHIKQFEIDWIRTDGVKRSIQVTCKAIHTAAGRFQGYRGVARDISESKASRLRTDEDETFFRNLVEITSDWVWEVDKDFVYTYSSPKVLDVLGFEPEEVIGKTPCDLMPEAEARRFAKLLRRLTQQRAPIFRFEKKGLRKDGGAVLLEMKGIPIIDAHGNILGYRGIDRDITGRRQKQAHFIQAQKMETIGQLTGGIAHDFNNLLTIIIGNLRLLKNQRNTLPDEDLQDLIDDSLSAAEDGGELTHQLLAFSRKQPLNPQQFNLNRLISDFTRLLRRTLSQDIKFAIATDSDVPEVCADPSQLQNALLNLALNARDAIHSGGTLTLTTSCTDILKHNWSPGLDPGSYAVVTVADTGHGIPADVLPHIFEPFFTTKEAGKGSGLGLSMVYGFAKQSGGTVTVESKPGKGTRMSLYLPVTTRKALVEEDTQPTNSSMFAAGRILVVDDEPRVRRFAVRCLKAQGYNVLEADDGDHAKIILMRKPDIDLLFSDIVMPGTLNGINLAKWALNTYPKLKILLTTGFSHSLQDDNPLTNGCDFPIVQKPFSENTLAEQIRELLKPKNGYSKTSSR